MTRRESKRRKKFPSIFTGEGSRPTKQTMIVFLSRQRNLVFALFSRVPWGREGREIGGPGNRARAVSARGLKTVRFHTFTFFNRGIQATRSHLATEHSIPSIMDLSSCHHERTSLIVLASSFPFSFFLPPSPPLSLLFRSFHFSTHFFLSLFSSVGRGTACVWRVIDSTSNSINEKTLCRHKDDTASTIDPPQLDRPRLTVVFPSFSFSFFLFLKKLPRLERMEKGEKRRVSGFTRHFLFSLFLSFFPSFHKSKRNSFISTRV